jgi:hypothetical protein
MFKRPFSSLKISISMVLVQIAREGAHTPMMPALLNDGEFVLAKERRAGKGELTLSS